MALIDYSMMLQDVFFWIPIFAPVLFFALPILAVYFLAAPSDEYTVPLQMSAEYPDSLYSWAVNKTLYMGIVLMMPMTYWGLGLQFTDRIYHGLIKGSFAL